MEEVGGVSEGVTGSGLSSMSVKVREGSSVVDSLLVTRQTKSRAGTESGVPAGRILKRLGEKCVRDHNPHTQSHPTDKATRGKTVILILVMFQSNFVSHNRSHGVVMPGQACLA